MMKNIIPACLITILFTSACSIIFEDDISVETVAMLLPQEGTITTDQYQVFWWETITEATEYKLQIVVGSFTAPEILILDSTIQSDKCEITLSPNTYQWRIKALNNYSETEFTIGNLVVDDTTNLVIEDDISNYLLSMIIPKDGTITNDSILQFWWELIPGATDYKLQIVTGSFDSPRRLIVDITTQEDKYEMKLQSDSYQWRIKAWNANSETEFAYGDLLVQDTNSTEQVTEPQDIN